MVKKSGQLINEQLTNSRPFNNLTNFNEIYANIMTIVVFSVLVISPKQSSKEGYLLKIQPTQKESSGPIIYKRWS